MKILYLKSCKWLLSQNQRVRNDFFAYRPRYEALAKHIKPFLKRQKNLFFNFRCYIYEKKLISLAYFLRSRWNNTFHWKVHSLILFKLSWSWKSEQFLSLSFEKSNVSSANVLHIDITPSGKKIISGLLHSNFKQFILIFYKTNTQLKKTLFFF